MLELKNIKKIYSTGDFKQSALKGINLEFRKNEFVSILGPSGSGKTTLLNIIGGLDKYTSGDLIINSKSTKKFKDTDWDSYRNNTIGFIFQSYNLISHISILDNVEMGMTLSGVSPKKRRKKAIEVLKKVGLKDHYNKKPNQLSGGQMQRVAIARALANNPDIILADEPTGALDSNTSIQIMNLIKEIAKDKLVIMVTHNPELANAYANRIIEMKDGEVINDSNPVKNKEDDLNNYKIKKTTMNYLTALNLSFNNIKTKKGRTALTAFASSIGIIGISLILALSNGFQIKIDEFEKDTLSQAPIIVSTQAMTMDDNMISQLKGANENLEKYTDEKIVYSQQDISETLTHKNVITKKYIEYIDNIDVNNIAGISYQKSIGFNIISKNNNTYKLVDTTNMNTQPWTLLPTNSKSKNNLEVIENNYDILYGEIDDSKPGLILQVDSKNQVYMSTLKQLGFNEKDKVTFDEILNKELKVVINDEYYSEFNGIFIPNTNYETLYNSKNSITLKVQAIIRGKEEKESMTSGSGIGYTNSLVDLIISKNKDSKIVKAQETSNINVLSGQPFDENSNSYNTKDYVLSYLGAESIPSAIYIYPKNFETKEKITDYLDEYNKDLGEENKIEYTDMASMISSLTNNIMDAITVVLIAFSSISLVVSSIMIGIITYISVLERTKEIGILRSLGARKKDIKRVFNAETFIIGLCSGLLGILISRLLIIPANSIIQNLTELKNVAKLNPVHAIILIMISVLLTVIGGFIPAKIAAKKDPVDALRTE